VTARQTPINPRNASREIEKYEDKTDTCGTRIEKGGTIRKKEKKKKKPCQMKPGKKTWGPTKKPLKKEAKQLIEHRELENSTGPK